MNEKELSVCIHSGATSCISWFYLRIPKGFMYFVVPKPIIKKCKEIEKGKT